MAVSKRDVLQALTKGELLTAAVRGNVEVPSRVTKDGLVDVLVSKRSVTASTLLRGFKRDRLKDLCCIFGMSEHGREKQILIERLLGGGNPSTCGKPFEDRASYYNKIFKSKPFRLAGKSELARDVIEFSVSQTKEVRFITEEVFRSMVSVIANPKHLLLFWLAWDIGESIGALLQLAKRDFTQQRNEYTGETEYLIHLPKAKIKRSRQTRSEPTLYPETVRYADMVLTGLGENEPVFGFGHRQALQIMHRAASRSDAKCMPNGERPTWKDIRSGMASHLLRSGWSREEVDARLGHTPNSSALNAYINFLTIDRSKPKKKLFDSSLRDLQFQLQETLRREKLTSTRLQRQEEENSTLQSELAQTRSDILDLRSVVKELISRITPGKYSSSSAPLT